MAALLAFASSVIWGTADFYGGLLSRKRNPVAVVLLVQVFGLFFVLVWALATGSWEFGGFWLSGIAAGVTGLAGLMFFYAALASGTMGVISPVAALGVVVPLSYGLFLGDQPTTIQWMGILTAIVGVMAASGPEISGGVSARPLLFGVAAATFFGVALAFMANGALTNATMTIVAMRIIQTIIAVGFFAYWKGFKGLQREDLPTIALVGLGDVAANICYALAAAMGPISIVAVLGSLPPIATATLGALVLKERLKLVQYVGVGLAMLGVVALNAG